MLIIRNGETQRVFVKRVLLDSGSLSVHAALFDVHREDGTRFPITRLASVIHDLRHNDGVVITQVRSTYTLVRTGLQARSQAAWTPEAVPVVRAPLGSFICPAEGCAERLALHQAKPSALDENIVSAPCPTHGWQTVRIAA